MIKENQVAVSGRVNGVWNNDTKAFEIKTGVSKGGVKWQIFEIQVSKKDGDDWVNGKGLKVMLWGDATVCIKDMIGVLGRFIPDNYTNRDGALIKGHSIVADSKDVFVPESWGDSVSNIDNIVDSEKEDLPF